MNQATKANRAQVAQHIQRQRNYVKYGSFYLDAPRPIELIVTGGILVCAIFLAFLK